MAQRISVELIDDVDGKKADETVSFSLDGVEYEIDMTKKNAAALRKAFSLWQDHARRVGRQSKTRRPQTRVDVGVDTRAVRAWAESNGHAVPARGRIRSEIIDLFRAAGN
jgi:hypothetical protein